MQRHTQGLAARQTRWVALGACCAALVVGCGEDSAGARPGDVALTDGTTFDVQETIDDSVGPASDVTSQADTPQADAPQADATQADAPQADDAANDTANDAVNDTADATAPLPCGATAALWDELLGQPAGTPLRVVAMTDGGLTLASSNGGKAEILRRSSTGAAAWSHVFQPSGGAQTNALAAYTGGSVLVAGQRGTATKTQGWLAALDAKGQVLWQHTVQFAQTFNGKIVTSDGPLTDVTLIGGKPVAVGHHAAPSGSGKQESSLTWFDTTGKITAQDFIFLGGSSVAEAVNPWEQGGVVVAGVGYGQSADGDVFVTTWVAPGEPGGLHGVVQVLPTPGKEQVVGVVSLGKGRVAVAGQRTLAGQTSLMLMLVDGSGKSVSQVSTSWMKAPATTAHALWRTSLGGLLLAAEAAPAGGLQTNKGDSWLVEMGPAGGVVWERDVSDPTTGDFLADVATLADGKVVAVGARGGVLRVLRTSPWGHTSCAAAGQCVALSLVGCDDGNPCTAAVCDATAGCQNPVFSQGTPCPAGFCSSGVCAP